jgi:putative RecB family exonuclease
MTEPQLRNAHLSYSRLSRYEQCPLSYKLHYLDHRTSEPGIPLRFGKVIHATLERWMRETVDDERVGTLSTERAFVLFQEAWNAEHLTGVELFEEGLQILRDFARDQGVVNHRDILAIERSFELQVGRFTVVGAIDRVDWVDAETIEVIDFKTNHALFAREELDSTLQLSLYEIAARRLWPWVKHVKLTYWLVRHGAKQGTTRTPEQLAAALRYIEALGEQTESAEVFPAQLNTNCVHCDHRVHCPAYADALTGRRSFVGCDPSDLQAVAREREEVATLAKILYARKDELERVLKAQLEHEDELALGGVRYRMFNATSFEYPLEPTLTVLAEATGRSKDELLGELAAVDKKALDSVLKELGSALGKPRLQMLKAELESHADKRLTPRFWAKKEVA